MRNRSILLDKMNAGVSPDEGMFWIDFGEGGTLYSSLNLLYRTQDGKEGRVRELSAYDVLVGKVYLVGAESSSKLAVSTSAGFIFNNSGGDEVTIGGKLDALRAPAGEEPPAMDINCFAYMFKGAPIVDASRLEFPVVDVAVRAYSNMFSECTVLVRAPEILTARSFGAYACAGMFNKCTALEAAPELIYEDADSIGSSCYQQMFAQCTSLQRIRCLLSSVVGKTSEDVCTRWLYRVSATGTLVCAPGSSAFWVAGNNGIPSGWTVEEV